MEEASLVNDIIQSALEMGWLQWSAFLCSVIYVVLAAQENIWCWFFGLIGVTLTFVVYIDPDVRLYSEALLQIFYAVMSIYGWIAWRNPSNKESSIDGHKDANQELAISTWSFKKHLQLLIIGTIGALFWGYVWSHFGAALPYIDAFTSSFAVIATYMVTRKILENWIYWIIIDFAGIFVSIHRELYLFAILFIIYCVIAVFGYFRWKREYSLQGI